MKLNIKYEDVQFKQHFKVIYLGRLLVETMSGEAKTLDFANNINKS